MTQSSMRQSNVKKPVTRGHPYSGMRRSPDWKQVGPKSPKGNGPGSKIGAEGLPITNLEKQAGPEINLTRSGQMQSAKQTRVHQGTSPNRAMKIIINNILRKTVRNYPENRWIR